MMAENILLINFVNQTQKLTPPSSSPTPPSQQQQQQIVSGIENIFDIANEPQTELKVILFGYITPIFFLITLVANVLIVLVLSKPTMRSPTNLVLLSMAVADLLTLIFPVPWYFYMYTLGYYRFYLNPSSICNLYNVMSEILPTFFHTASIWCTLLLACQRYIFICHPIMAKVWCTQQRVSRAIIAIFTLAFIHQLLRFFEGYYIDTTLKIRLPIRSETFDDNSSKSFATFINDIVDDDGDGGVGGGIFSRRNRTAKLKNIDLIRGENVSVFDGVGGENDDDDDLVKYSIKNACQLVMSNWIDKIEDLYFGSYFVFRIVFVHIGPCLLLVLFNVLLYNALKRAEKIRNKLLNLNPNSKQIAIKKNSNSEISGGCVCVCNNLQQNHRKRSSLMSVPSAQIDHKIGSNPGVPSETNDDRSANSILIIPKRQSQCNDYHKCFTPSNSLEQNSSNNSNMADNNHNNNNNNNQTINYQQRRQQRSNRDTNSTTFMLIVIVTVFLIVEIPLAIATAVHVLENMLKLDIVSDRFLFMTIIFSNFLIIISYPLNFAIYCGMSKAFRETFKQMFLKNSLFHHIFYNSNPHNHNHHHHHHHHQHHAHANHQHYHRKQSQQIDGRNSISFSNRKSSEARVINEDETSKKSPRYHRFLMLSKRSQTNQSITTPLISTTASISMTTTTTTTTTMNNNASNNTVSFVENDQCPSASDPLSANNLGKSGQFHIDDDFDVDNGDERDNHQEDGEKTQATESIIVRINNQETMV